MKISELMEELKNFKEKLLESQRRQKEIWLKEFEKNGRKLSVWELDSEKHFSSQS